MILLYDAILELFNHQHNIEFYIQLNWEIIASNKCINKLFLVQSKTEERKIVTS